MLDNPDSPLYRVARLVLREYTPPRIWERVRGGVTARLCRAESFGKGAVVRGKVQFRFRGRVVIGNDLEANGQSCGVRIVVFKEGKLTIGDSVRINVGVWIEVGHETRIGNHVMLAPYTTIVDDNRHDIEPGAPRFKRPVIIGDNVWLGQKVSVMPGVTIGDNAVIGANSVVSNDIPPNVFAAGAPARVIRPLDIPDGWDRVAASDRKYSGDSADHFRQQAPSDAGA